MCLATHRTPKQIQSNQPFLNAGYDPAVLGGLRGCWRYVRGALALHTTLTKSNRSGGTAGLSLASRLSQRDPSLDILVIEAGPDQAGHPLTGTPFGAFTAGGSDIDWSYKSIPQKQLSNRVIPLSAGKVLSGATAINYGLWLRGPAADYDRWAELVGDRAWSYESLLPYFRRLEKHHDPKADAEQHGFEGVMHTMSPFHSDPVRKFPLSKLQEDAWRELGTERIRDQNAGHPLGLAEIVEN